ncbi:dTDP-4-dehydrorhamnose reductase [Gorillibacterium sp. sgz500922]|uniref:dTDP-4-dehydrorhamnose reductase n=1 Tax=Gorillibacterium sp. sgz500922 TaxID=3446694 RepID=UPI003F6635AA
MRILVTGANGQLGSDLVAILEKSGHDVLGTDRMELNITNQEICDKVITEHKPEVILHTAAYTAVDQAEEDVEAAYLVNAVGTRNVAVAAEKVGSRLCYISTDYVFDGIATKPYHEYDNTDPKSIYGKSKRAGEVLTMSLCKRSYVVRTSWVYGQNGQNFVKTMLKLGRERDVLKVVNDQVGSPTYTNDLCCFLADLIQTERFGIYHATNQGECSWYEFARAIFDEAGISVRLEPCTTDEFPRPAPRPSYSVLSSLAIRTNGFRELRNWREAVSEFISNNSN